MQQIIKQFNEDSQIVSTLFKFLQFTIFNHDKQSAVVIVSYPQLESMLLKSTLMTENLTLRNEVLRRLKDIICIRTGSPQEMSKLISIVKIFLLDLQAVADKYELRCSLFYEGITYLLDNVSLQDIEILSP